MEERKGFGSNFGFLMAAIGSAVGLGNIWGFPNKMGANGGFTFLIIYLILAVLCGFIVMVGELAIGRKTGKGAIAAYRSLSQRFKWVGWLGVASAFLIMSFYCALGGYCLKYVVLNIGNLTGAAFGSNGLSGSEVFGTFLTSQGEGVIYGLIFVVLTMVIVMGGVAGGIEKFCGIGMPALFFMLLICIVRACTLPGAVDGLKYMFVPGWAVANGVTVGTSATTFSPDAPVTRSQAVTFPWRAAGSPVVAGDSFDDVAADAYYAGAVTWAVANGITNGTGGNKFSPEVTVTRAQAVTFLWRELA